MKEASNLKLQSQSPATEHGRKVLKQAEAGRGGGVGRATCIERLNFLFGLRYSAATANDLNPYHRGRPS